MTSVLAISALISGDSVLFFNIRTVPGYAQRVRSNCLYIFTPAVRVHKKRSKCDRSQTREFCGSTYSKLDIHKLAHMVGFRSHMARQQQRDVASP